MDNELVETPGSKNQPELQWNQPLDDHWVSHDPKKHMNEKSLSINHHSPWVHQKLTINYSCGEPYGLSVHHGLIMDSPIHNGYTAINRSQPP